MDYAQWHRDWTIRVAAKDAEIEAAAQAAVMAEVELRRREDELAAIMNETYPDAVADQAYDRAKDARHAPGSTTIM